MADMGFLGFHGILFKTQGLPSCLIAFFIPHASERPLTLRTMYLMLQEPRNKKTAVEEQLVQEVERLKAKVEAGKACFLEKYKECQRLHKQIRQLRAATRVGDRDVGPRKQGV